MNANLMNKSLQQNDKIKRYANNIFQNEIRKNNKELKNLNFKKNRFGINIIRISLFKFILFINLFISTISAYKIKIQTISANPIKICKCKNISPPEVLVDNTVFPYNVGINYYYYYGTDDDFLYIYASPASEHTIILTFNSFNSNLKGFFQGCDKIESIDFSNFYNAMDNVQDMSYLFDSCSSLKSIIKLNIKYAVDLSYLFSNCHSLVSIEYIYIILHPILRI